MFLIGCFQLGQATAQVDTQEDASKLERLKILREHEVIDENGRPRLGKIENSELPADLAYPKGVLSMTADPKAKGGGRIAVYIINASGKPVMGLYSEAAKLWQEVLDGETWKLTEPFPVHYDITFSLMDHALAAGHTLITTGKDPAMGDVDGNLRYCLSVPGERPVISQVICGKFSKDAFEKATFTRNEFELSIMNDFRQGVLRDIWGSGLVTNREEFAAAVELLRTYDECSALRNSIREWLQEPRDKTIGEDHELDKVEASLRQSLASPWERTADEHKFFVHCLGLLSVSEAAKKYGMPENGRAVVWRFLVNWPTITIGPINQELFDHLAANKASGNPWRAEAKEMSLMIGLAEADLTSKDPAVQNAAGRFLTGTWISDGLFENDRYRRLLKVESSVARRTGLLGLAGRNRRDEAIEWLGLHYETLGTELKWAWYTLSNRDDPLAPWEIPIVTHLLSGDPLQTFFDLNCRLLTTDSPNWEMPVGLRKPVKEYLIREARERKVVGEKLPAYDSGGKRVRYEEESTQPGHLAAALSILAHCQIPEDTEVLRSFLDHPAASYSRYDKVTETKYYTVRAKALSLLKSRGEETPGNAVLEEKIRARDLPPP